MSDNPFVFFIHVPKTAGSSFLSILGRGFRERFLGVYSQIHREVPYSMAQLEEFVTDHGERYDCLASHRLSGVFPAKVGDRDCVGISFVRDPFDLFASHYFYHRFHVPGFGKARELSLEEYFEYAIVEGNHSHYIDWQYHLLTGRGLPEADRPGMEEIEKMVKDRRLLLFPTKAFDSACVLLGKLHPGLFRSTWYHRRNISKKDQPEPPGLRERFREYAPRDFDILELAGNQHKELVEEFFPNEGDHEAAMEKFRRNGKRSRLIHAPRALTKRMLLKIANSL